MQYRSMVLEAIQYSATTQALAQVSQQHARAYYRSGFEPSMAPLAMPQKARRKLRRNMSSQHADVEVKLQKCIRGGKRMQWMVLDTHVFMERECVGIKSTQKWLHVVLAGTLHRSTCHHAIRNFVNDCHDALRKLGAV